MLGPRSLFFWFSALSLIETSEDASAGNSILEGLWRLGQKSIDARRPIIDDFTKRLSNYAMHDESYNGFLIIGLEKLRAKEAIPTIAAAYADDEVDEFCESWEGVVGFFRLPSDSSPSGFI